MRNDSVGLFWSDVPIIGKQKKMKTFVLPPIPETGWKPPAYFPDLSGASCIALDTETFDPELLDNGPGWARGRGHVVGVSIGVPEGVSWYFPIRHEIGHEMNMPVEHVTAWLRDTLKDHRQPKIGANLLYDLGWLRQEGIEVAGELVDVQFAEALLDERASVALEAIGQKYLKEGKDSSILYQWCADAYGGKETGTQRANLYRTHPKLVGPYAEMDATLPIRCADVMYKYLVKENLYDLFRMECDLIRFLLEMRWQGVRVDVAKAHEVYETLEARAKSKQVELNDIAGFEVLTGSSHSLAILFEKLGLEYPRTAGTESFPQGQPSFVGKFLETVEHPVGALIQEIKKCEKLQSTFLKSYIFDSHINGRLFCQFHPLRGDEGGTRSGRYSSSTPNLQNIPSRDEELAPLIRGLFLPEANHKQWRRFDYSQIEYRFLAHFAIGPGSDELRQRYNDNPKSDFHELIRQLIHEKAGLMLQRKPTKTINFGLCYGMGKPKLARSLGLDKTKADELFAAYHKGAPYAKATFDFYADQAQKTGIITTILGRKSRFDMWEPARRGGSDCSYPYHIACRMFSKIQRSGTHKALNRQLQGSAADMAKMASWKAMKAGVFARIGYPRLVVHDEFDFSDPGNVDDGFREFRRILETAIPLRIPILADEEVGKDWGHAH